MQYVVFHYWLLSISKLLLRFIYVIACTGNLFFLSLNTIPFYVYTSLHYFLKPFESYLFFTYFFERRVSEQGRGKKREKERESQAVSVLAEPDAGLNLVNCEILT